MHGRSTINLRHISKLDVNTAKNSTATVCLTIVHGENVLQIVLYQQNVLKFSPAKTSRHIMVIKYCMLQMVYSITACGPRLSAVDMWYGSGGM